MISAQCKYLAMGGECMYGCSDKQIVCHRFMRSQCTRGDRCWNLHSQDAQAKWLAKEWKHGCSTTRKYAFIICVEHVFSEIVAERFMRVQKERWSYERELQRLSRNGMETIQESNHQKTIGYNGNRRCTASRVNLITPRF